MLKTAQSNCNWYIPLLLCLDVLMCALTLTMILFDLNAFVGELNKNYDRDFFFAFHFLLFAITSGVAVICCIIGLWLNALNSDGKAWLKAFNISSIAESMGVMSFLCMYIAWVVSGCMDESDDDHDLLNCYVAVPVILGFIVLLALRVYGHIKTHKFISASQQLQS
eukprot:335109_1